MSTTTESTPVSPPVAYLGPIPRLKTNAPGLHMLRSSADLFALAVPLLAFVIAGYRGDLPGLAASAAALGVMAYLVIPSYKGREENRARAIARVWRRRRKAATGADTYRSDSNRVGRLADGTAVPATPPLIVGRIRTTDHPITPDRLGSSFGITHDPRRRSIVVGVEVASPGGRLLDLLTQINQSKAFAGLIAHTAQPSVIFNRMQLIMRTIPSDKAAHRQWTDERVTSAAQVTAPQYTQESYERLIENTTANEIHYYLIFSATKTPDMERRVGRLITDEIDSDAAWGEFMQPQVKALVTSLTTYGYRVLSRLSATQMNALTRHTLDPSYALHDETADAGNIWPTPGWHTGRDGLTTTGRWGQTWHHRAYKTTSYPHEAWLGKFDVVLLLPTADHQLIHSTVVVVDALTPSTARREASGRAQAARGRVRRAEQANRIDVDDAPLTAARRRMEDHKAGAPGVHVSTFHLLTASDPERLNDYELALFNAGNDAELRIEPMLDDHDFGATIALPLARGMKE